MRYFFHLNFLRARGILAQKLYNAHTIFRQFSDIKIGGRTKRQPSVLGQLVTGESQHTGVSCPKES